jgi:hypothetical protein
MLNQPINRQKLEQYLAANNNKGLAVYILQHYQEFLAEAPEELMEVLPTCLSALAKMPKAKLTSELILDSVQKIMTDDGGYYPLFILKLRLRTLNAMLPEMAEDAAMRPYLDMAILQIWAQLKQHKNDFFSLLDESPHILSTPAMLKFLTERLQETDNMELALECLQHIVAPMHADATRAKFAKDSLETMTTLDSLYSQLLNNYNKSKHKEICPTVAHLIRQGIQPREELRKQWIAQLTSEIESQLISPQLLTTITTLIALIDAQRVSTHLTQLIFDKLMAYFSQQHDVTSANYCLKELVAKSPTVTLPLLFAAYQKGIVSLRVLCDHCAGLAPTLLNKYYEPLSTIISATLETKSFDELAPVLPLLQQHRTILDTVIARLDGKEGWNTTTLILLYRACGYQDVKNLVLNQVTRERVIQDLNRRIQAGEPGGLMQRFALAKSAEEREPLWSIVEATLQKEENRHIFGTPLIRFAQIPKEKARLWAIFKTQAMNPRLQSTTSLIGLIELANTVALKQALWPIVTNYLNATKTTPIRTTLIDAFLSLVTDRDISDEYWLFLKDFLLDTNAEIEKTILNLAKLASTPETKNKLRPLFEKMVNNESDASVRSGAIQALVSLASTPEDKSQLWAYLLLIVEFSHPEEFNNTVVITSLSALIALANTPQERKDIWNVLKANLLNPKIEKERIISLQAVQDLIKTVGDPNEHQLIFNQLKKELDIGDTVLKTFRLFNLSNIATTPEQRKELLTLIRQQRQIQGLEIHLARALSTIITATHSPQEKNDLWIWLRTWLQDEQALLKSSTRRAAIDGLIQLATTPEQKTACWPLLLAELRKNNNSYVYLDAVKRLVHLATTSALRQELWQFLASWPSPDIKLSVDKDSSHARLLAAMHIEQLKQLQQQAKQDHSTMPGLLRFLSLKDATVQFSTLAIVKLIDQLEQLNYFYYNFNIMTIQEISITMSLPLDTIPQLTLPEILLRLKASHPNDAWPLIKLLYDNGLHAPCMDFFEWAFRSQHNFKQNYIALVELLLSVEALSFKLDAPQIVRSMLPIYTDEDTQPDRCLWIERPLLGHHIVQLPQKFLETCLQRAQGGERLTHELLAIAELDATLTQLLAQLRSSQEEDKEKLNKLIAAAPLSKLMQCAITLGTAHVLTSVLQPIVLNKISKLSSDQFKSELNRATFTLLLSYYELSQQDERFTSHRAPFIEIMQQKLNTESLPVREDMLMSDPPHRLPAELLPTVTFSPEASGSLPPPQS